MLISAFKNNYIKLFIIVLISFLIDNFLILSINNPPAWDQGYHLSNVFKMYNILDTKNLSFLDKINEILNVTDSYRGPITYLFSALFLKLFSNNYHFAYLSNNIFNSICIVSIFYLGRFYKNELVGIWSAVIFSFSSLIIQQRSDYLIDLSLTSFCLLNLLFLFKWFISKSNRKLFGILSGISLGLVFLAKPTGITLFILPITIIFLKIFKNKEDFNVKLIQLILFLFSFIFIVYPWFSRHWITIISSILNAWSWGINYQEGFEKGTIENWLYYFTQLPLVFGKINFSVFSVIFLFDNFYKKNIFKNKKSNLDKINIWFSIYIFNCYLILSLMSTKDIRFILPVYPIFCIYLSNLINTSYNKFFTAKNKKIILIIVISFSLFLDNNLNNFNPNYISSSIWPHKQIINEIKDKNPNFTSVLAILPDTKEINTFNLEAEASRQGEYVAVRQIISNLNSYKDDLKYFDWFLLKTGDQGEMSNESKNLLDKYLLNSDSFVTHREWILKDQSKLKLLRRRTLNSSLSKKECDNYSPTLQIKQINNGINIELFEKGEDIKSGNLLIDFIDKDFKKFTNLSLGNDFFHKDFDENSCYRLSQNISVDFPRKIKESYFLKANLLTEEGELRNLKIKNDELIVNQQLFASDYIQMVNRISKVELLGSYLRKGEYKNLFNLVGIINQSDPKLTYLKNAEKIYLQRYKEDNDFKNLYSVLISQILQRKILDSEKTINLILKADLNNGNAYLAKSIINVYLLDKKNARLSIEKAKQLEKSQESSEILNLIEGLNYLLEMKFINAYKIFANT